MAYCGLPLVELEVFHKSEVEGLVVLENGVVEVLPDARMAALQGSPRGLNGVSERRDCSHSGDDHSAHQ